MTHRYCRRAIVRRFGLLLGLLCLVGAAPCGLAAARKEARAEGYQPYVLGPDGNPQAGELDRVTAGIRREAGAEGAVLVVMIHGFNTSMEQGRLDYRTVARRLRAAGGPGVHPVPIGIHWPSDPGPLWAWLPQAVGFRFTAGLGFPNAVRNPYLDKVQLAHRMARTGVRALLARFQDDFPGVPVHILAHSLGSDIVVTALAPESAVTASDEEIESRGRELHAGLVVLAGADLDQDVFAQPDRPEVRRALDRAGTWWVTLPGDQAADGALELRRGAGRHDALGNQGPTFLREDFDRLMARRGLVLDRGNIPIRHALIDYYDDRRVRSIVRSMAYLRSPAQSQGQESLVAAADRVLRADEERLDSFLQKGNATEQLYAGWRLSPTAARYGPVKVGVGRSALGLGGPNAQRQTPNRLTTARKRATLSSLLCVAKRPGGAA